MSAAVTPRETSHRTSRPRSLNELRQTARLALKLNGKLQFFNEAGTEIKTERGLNETKDGEVIEVTSTKQNFFRSGCKDPLKSTLQADFVDHMQYERPASSHIESMSVLTKDAMRGKFDGTSVYAQDFAAKGPSKRASIAYVQPTFSRHFLQHSTPAPGTTSYHDQFRHLKDSSQRAECVDTASIRKSTLTDLSRGHKLEATTSYRTDFARHGNYRPEPHVKPAFADNDSTLTDATRSVPFEGESVYQAHFLLHNVGPTESAKPVSAGLGQDLPFQSGTEYSDQFVNRKGIDPNIILRHAKS